MDSESEPASGIRCPSAPDPAPLDTLAPYPSSLLPLAGYLGGPVNTSHWQFKRPEYQNLTAIVAESQQSWGRRWPTRVPVLEKHSV